MSEQSPLTWDQLEMEAINNLRKIMRHAVPEGTNETRFQACKFILEEAWTKQGSKIPTKNAPSKETDKSKDI